MIYIFTQDDSFRNELAPAFPGGEAETYSEEARMAGAITRSRPDGVLFDLRSRITLPRLLERVYLEIPSIPVVGVVARQPFGGRSLRSGFCLAVDSAEVAASFEDIRADREAIAACGLVGRSEELATAARVVLQVAPTDINVLITGPSGAGKEMIARALHTKSC